MGRITRGWTLAKVSMRVLARDRSLALFPIISIIAWLVAIAAIAVPGYILIDSDSQVPYYVLGALIAFVGTFITVFFNVALVSCAARSFEGHDTTVGEGIAAASSRIGVIFQWTLLATTVGLLLRALEERVPLAGRIAVWLVGAAWAVVTYFVIPVIAFEEVGPVDAVKRSGNIVRARWGEAIVGNVGIGAATTLLAFVVAIPLLVIGLLATSTAMPLAVVCVALAVLAFIAASVLGSTLTQIFNTALYTFATTDTVPAGFSSTDLTSAFRTKR